MTKTQEYKGQIRSKRLGGTGVTEDQVRQLYGRKGKFFVGLVEVEVEETHEKKDGLRKVDLLLNQVWIVTDEDGDLEPHLRQLMRTLHQNKVLHSDQEALDIQMQDDLEPSVPDVIAAQRAHAAGEPHIFEPAEADEDGGACWCGEVFEADVHQVVGSTPLVPAGLSGEELDAWVSGDAVEGDETDNPERWAAYLARVEAARIAQGEPADEDELEPAAT